jgi:hypothetical protein
MPQKDKPQYEVSQWLQILRKPYRDRALASWKEIGRPKDKYDNLHEAINNGTCPMCTQLWGSVIDSEPKTYIQPRYLHLIK